jgi:hypothetical protein
MADKLIAVAADDEGNIAAHAGRAENWMVYVVGDDGVISLAWMLALTPMGSLHEWHVRGDGNRHPLHTVDIAIAGSAGDGVIRRLGERGTELITTTETIPLKAVQGYLAGGLAEGLPHDEQSCLKGHH